MKTNEIMKSDEVMKKSPHQPRKKKVMKNSLSTFISCMFIYRYLNTILSNVFLMFFQKLPEVPLTEEIVGDSLSLLCKIGSGLAHAYVRLDVKDK